MQKLTRADLYTPEQYVDERAAFRARVLAHLKHRCVQLGPHAALLLLVCLFVRFLFVVLLCAERNLEGEHVATSLASFIPLIPDGRYWKASCMLEGGDTGRRHAALPHLVGIERRVWGKIDTLPPVFAVADEQPRGGAHPRSSATQLLRFELTPDHVTAAKAGVSIAVGSDHPAYHHVLDPLPGNIRAALVNDLA